MSGNPFSARGWAPFACGVILLYWFGAVLPFYGLFGAAVALLCGIYLIRHRATLSLLVFLAWLLAGLGWASWSAEERLADRLPRQVGGQSLEGVPLTVTGYLCDIPATGSFGSVRFPLCVDGWPEFAAEEAAQLPTRLRLAWYGSEATRDLPHRVRATVVLKRPHGSVNPAGFRYETWLYRQGFGATGTVRDIEAVTGGSCSLACHYHQARGRLAARLRALLGEARHFPLIASLAMGDRGAMTPAHWEVLKATGTIHLVAISGLHLGLVAIGVGLILRQLLTRMPLPARTGMRWLTPGWSRAVTFCLVVAASLVYALVAGFTVPTRRALVMVAIAGWLILRGQQGRSWQGWGLALAVVLVIDPAAPLDQGFWLSFGAVAVLLLTFARRMAGSGWLAGLLLAQFAVFAGLWPILAVLGQDQTLMGFPANLLAIPLVSVLVMPAVLAGVCLVLVFPATVVWVAPVLDAVVELLWRLLEWLAAVPVPQPLVPLPVVVAFAVLVLILLAVPSTGARRAALVVIGCWAAGSVVWRAAPVNSAGPEYPELRVWDVGQGLSVLIRHRDRVILYDSGPESPAGYSAVASVLLPGLRAQGIRRIDTLIVSHGDRDHAGGLPLLLGSLQVDRIITGEPARLRELLGDGEGIPEVEPCRSGAAVPGLGLDVRLWHFSAAAGVAAARLSGNDRSCALLMRANGTEVVIPGDLSVVAEPALIDFIGEVPAPRRRLVIAGHHGSKTSSSVAWVAALTADVVVYSAGYRHRYGHPYGEVVRRYREAGAESFNTAYSGALRFLLTPQGIVSGQERDGAPFWIRPPEAHWQGR